MTGYDGRFCTEDFDGCSSVICFEEVTCVDVPAPGVGAMCGPCPAGYFGNGQKCDGTKIYFRFGMAEYLLLIKMIFHVNK